MNVSAVTSHRHTISLTTFRSSPSPRPSSLHFRSLFPFLRTSNSCLFLIVFSLADFRNRFPLLVALLLRIWIVVLVQLCFLCIVAKPTRLPYFLVFFPANQGIANFLNHKSRLAAALPIVSVAPWSLLIEGLEAREYI
ncbi:hypothetical protein L6164_036430 [Bauhinia variegata]|uniref:Uncharacterized protein n=1 Tax=Bauhinia variegata TaxID=167791 RepID=A0ACB9KGZ3_BAUVA|nr:hypothetical protein L6164_036430 [Bauhinia variegata]